VTALLVMYWVNETQSDVLCLKKNFVSLSLRWVSTSCQQISTLCILAINQHEIRTNNCRKLHPLQCRCNDKEVFKVNGPTDPSLRHYWTPRVVTIARNDQETILAKQKKIHNYSCQLQSTRQCCEECRSIHTFPQYVTWCFPFW
jgi:hypothetical protein